MKILIDFSHNDLFNKPTENAFKEQVQKSLKHQSLLKGINRFESKYVPRVYKTSFTVFDTLMLREKLE